MGINKAPRRIKKDAVVKLLYGEPKSPLYKPKGKPKDKLSGRTYIKFTRKKQLKYGGTLK